MAHFWKLNSLLCLMILQLIWPNEFDKKNSIVESDLL